MKKTKMFMLVLTSARTCPYSGNCKTQLKTAPSQVTETVN